MHLGAETGLCGLDVVDAVDEGRNDQRSGHIAAGTGRLPTCSLPLFVNAPSPG
jgi:hypothetical protein